MEPSPSDCVQQQTYSSGTGIPTLQQYVYQPLLGKDYFRLLHLWPGTGPLICSLVCQKIEESILSYDALSYAWDDQSNAGNNSLQCDDHCLVVPSTVIAALHVVRDMVKTRTVWVDKICINQADQDERAQQVMVMGSIYSNANQILIWLGLDHDKEARNCFDLIQHTNSILTELIGEYGDIYDVPTMAITQGRICTNRDKWAVVERMMQLKWFSRVWVLNEVGHARSALIMYGETIMKWSQLVELMLLAASRPDMTAFTGDIKSGTVWETFESIWRPFSPKVSWINELPFTRASNQQPSSGGSLITILSDLRVYNATDQRDRVYAFLNHPYAVKKNDTGEQVSIVTANYHVPVEEVYKEVASQLLRNDLHAWTVLSCVDHAGSGLSDIHAFPSWVPKWDESHRVYWLGYPEMWYRAGGSEQKFTCTIRSSGQQTFLALKGIYVGVIDWISESFTKESISATQQKKSRPLQQVWKTISQETENTAYGDDMRDRLHAYYLLLAAGRATDEGPAEDDADWYKLVFDRYENSLIQEAQPSTFGNNVEQDLLPGSLGNNNQQIKDLDFHVSTYISNQRRALTQRKIFKTSRGHYGVGHRISEKGDICMVLPGAGVPFVLRPVLSKPPSNGPAPKVKGLPDSGRYQLVGECYIQGLMRGQAIDMVQDSVKNGFEEIQIIIE